MKFIYFGHSRMSYGTKEEELALLIIRQKFPNHRILNPNKEKHQTNCDDFYTGVPGTEMEYFINLTKMCEFGIFMVYDENRWSPGSYTEAKYMIENGKEIFLLSPKGSSSFIMKRITEIDNHYTFDEESKKLRKNGKDKLAGENG